MCDGCDKGIVPEPWKWNVQGEWRSRQSDHWSVCHPGIRSGAVEGSRDKQRQWVKFEEGIKVGGLIQLVQAGLIRRLNDEFVL